MVSNDAQCMERDERETVRVSGTDRERGRGGGVGWGGGRKGNRVRHEEDKHCVHCLYGLVNILMKEPPPESQHQPHSDSHSD